MSLITGRRLALLIGSTIEPNDGKEHIDKEIINNNFKLIEDSIGMNGSLGEYGFSWIESKKGTGKKRQSKYHSKLEAYNLKTIIDPTVLRIQNVVSEIENVSGEDLLLFYYCGHGVKSNSELCFPLKGWDKRSNDNQFRLNYIIERFTDMGFKKLIIVLDCCHAGLAPLKMTIDKTIGVEYYILGASDLGYGDFEDSGGVFTKKLSESLHLGNRKAKGLINPRKNGITFKSWFDYTKSNLTAMQNPTSGGSLGDTLLCPVERQPSKSINWKAHKKSYYIKLYHILQLLEEGQKTTTDIKEIIKDRNLTEFLVAYTGDNRSTPSYVGELKIREYLDNASILGLISKRTKNNEQYWEIEKDGLRAIENHGTIYNVVLKEKIFQWLPSELEEKLLIKMLFEIVDSYDLPDINQIERKIIESKKKIPNLKLFRIVMQLLANAKIIRRAKPDTFFPPR